MLVSCSAILQIISFYSYLMDKKKLSHSPNSSLFCFMRRNILTLKETKQMLQLKSCFRVDLLVRYDGLIYYLCLNFGYCQCNNTWFLPYSPTSFWNQSQRQNQFTSVVILQDLNQHGSGWRGGCLCYHRRSCSCRN